MDKVEDFEVIEINNYKIEIPKGFRLKSIKDLEGRELNLEVDEIDENVVIELEEIQKGKITVKVINESSEILKEETFEGELKTIFFRSCSLNEDYYVKKTIINGIEVGSNEVKILFEEKEQTVEWYISKRREIKKISYKGKISTAEVDKENKQKTLEGIVYLLKYVNETPKKVVSSGSAIFLENKKLEWIKPIEIPVEYEQLKEGRAIFEHIQKNNTIDLDISYTFKKVEKEFNNKIIQLCNLEVPNIKYKISYENGNEDIVTSKNKTISLKREKIKNIEILEIPKNYKLENWFVKNEKDGEYISREIIIEFQKKEERFINKISIENINFESLKGIEYRVFYTDESYEDTVSNGKTIILEGNKKIKEIEFNLDGYEYVRKSSNIRCMYFKDRTEISILNKVTFKNASKKDKIKVDNLVDEKTFKEKARGKVLEMNNSLEIRDSNTIKPLNKKLVNATTMKVKVMLDGEQAYEDIYKNLRGGENIVDRFPHLKHKSDKFKIKSMLLNRNVINNKIGGILKIGINELIVYIERCQS